MRWGQPLLFSLVAPLLTGGCAANTANLHVQGPVAEVVKRPLRILTLGDSITQGRAVTRSNEPATRSWRYPLWRALVERGVAFDMVGGFRGGFEGDPDWPDVNGVPFDRDHESQWGHRLDEMTDILRGHLDHMEFDVVLVLLGANDLRQGQTLAELWPKWQSLLATLRAKNPAVKVVVGVYCAEWSSVPEYRAELTTRAPTWSTGASPIVAVDGCQGWASDPKAPGTDTVDWVHPNLQGDEKLARAFLSGLEQLVPEVTTAAKPDATRVQSSWPPSGASEDVVILTK